MRVPKAVPAIAAVILAAGRSRRFAGGNKLLARLGGEALLTRVLTNAALSSAAPVILVVGHSRGRLRPIARQALRLNRRRDWLRMVYNPLHREGLSSSLRTGIAAIPSHCAGALICLGDMPEADARSMNTIMGAFRSGDLAIVPTANGVWGNPVLLGRGLFPALATLTGDAGARRLLSQLPRVRFVELGAAAIASDIDTRSDLRRARQRRRRPRR
jgi:molybdenum cofactor cytidylyltransferase